MSEQQDNNTGTTHRYQDGMGRIARRRQTMQVDGRTIELSALTIGDFVEARQQALDAYRREHVRAWSVAAESLPDADRSRLLTDAVAKAAELTIDDLPNKKVQVPRRSRDGQVEQDQDGNPVLDTHTVDYGLWWASETIEGRLFCVWLSMRACPQQADISRDEVDVIFTELAEELAEAADTVVQLSQPQQTAEQHPKAESRQQTAQARRQKREARRRRRTGRQ